MPRRILHVDMDAFYAAVEQRDYAELRGKPVLVGGAGGRGVVCAASYEARPFGCRSAMPMSTALRICPQAIVMPVRMGRYREVSHQIFTIFDEFSPLVEPLSVDEAFLDLSGTEGLFGPAEEAARRLKRRILETTGLTASVGVAPNKFLAKLGSELRKPDGLVVIRPDEVQQVLDPLPIERLWGVGPATYRRFERLGVRKVADVRHLTSDRLRREFGPSADHFYRLARGLDDRPVTPDHQAKSISHESTFHQDVADLEGLKTIVVHQAEDVAHRLRRADLYARNVTLKLRYPDFTTITRAGKLTEPTHLTDAICRAALDVLEAWAADRFGALRLIGVAVGNLVGADGLQHSLFEVEDERKRKLDEAMDRIRKRFGSNAVRRRTPR
jgi:DNA polymerase IV